MHSSNVAKMELCLHRTRVWLFDQLTVLNKPLTPFPCQATEKQRPDLPAFLFFCPGRPHCLCALYLPRSNALWGLSQAPGTCEGGLWFQIGPDVILESQPLPERLLSGLDKIANSRESLQSEVLCECSTERWARTEFVSLEPDSLCCISGSTAHWIRSLEQFT